MKNLGQINDPKDIVTKEYVDNCLTPLEEKVDNTYTKSETDIAIANAPHLKRTIVTELPATGDTNTIYMVPATTVSENNIYLEYMYINDSWEKIGSSEVDLTDYVKNTDYATTNEAGVVKINSNSGLRMYSGGTLYCNAATKEEIDAKTQQFKPITPTNLEYAVKSVGDGYYALASTITELENRIAQLEAQLAGVESQLAEI